MWKRIFKENSAMFVKAANVLTNTTTEGAWSLYMASMPLSSGHLKYVGGHPLEQKGSKQPRRTAWRGFCVKNCLNL